MEVEEVGDVDVGDAELVLVGGDPPAGGALAVVVDLDALDLKLVASVLVLA